MEFRIPPFFIPGITRRDCAHCGSEYKVHHATQLYCSNRCRARAHRRRHPGGKPPEITRAGPRVEQQPSTSVLIEQALEINFSTEPSTAEDDILALWSKKEGTE